MSSQFINPTLVTTLVKITTIDNVTVVDVHALSSEWKHYLLQSGPVVSTYTQHLLSSLTHTYRDWFFAFIIALKVQNLNLAARLIWRDLLLLKCKYIPLITVSLMDLVITLFQRWCSVLYVPPGLKGQRGGSMWTRFPIPCNNCMMSCASTNSLKPTRREYGPGEYQAASHRCVDFINYWHSCTSHCWHHSRNTVVCIITVLCSMSCSHAKRIKHYHQCAVYTVQKCMYGRTKLCFFIVLSPNACKLQSHFLNQKISIFSHTFQ